MASDLHERDAGWFPVGARARVLGTLWDADSDRTRWDAELHPAEARWVPVEAPPSWVEDGSLSDLLNGTMRPAPAEVRAAVQREQSAADPSCDPEGQVAALAVTRAGGRVGGVGRASGPEPAGR